MKPIKCLTYTPMMLHGQFLIDFYDFDLPEIEKEVSSVLESTSTYSRSISHYMKNEKFLRNTSTSQHFPIVYSE